MSPFNSLISKNFAVATTFPKISTRGLVLHLDAGQQNSYNGSGTTWTDLSGNGNTGTLVNGVGYSASNGGALTFDGSNDFIEIAHNTILNPSLNMTLSCWINVNSFTNTMSMFGKGTTSSGFGGFDFRIDSPSQLNLVKYFIVDQRVDIPTLSTNTWYNISAVQDDTNVNYYVNGLNVGSFSNTIAYQNNTSSLRIGRNRSIIYTPARISNILYYNRALTAAEISQNFNAQRGRFGL